MQLAQINIGRILAPMDSEIMSGFKNNLEKINALAESSPGFVWRLKDENNNATDIKVFEDEFLLINMSVWENKDALFNYVYKSDHTSFLAKKKQWFEKLKDMHLALWFVENGHHPTPTEAIERLEYLRKHGDTPFAFSFRAKFTEEDLQEYLKEK